MSAPGKGQINDRAGFFYLIQQPQTFLDDSSLLRFVAGFAKRMTEGPFQKNCTWRFNLLCILPDDGDADGGDSCFFNNPLDQSHGLIADPSAGG